MKTRTLFQNNLAVIDSAQLMNVTGNFIDDFNSADEGQRRAMIEHEPENIGLASPYTRAIIAGMVEWLCNRYGMEYNKPAWIYEREYYLEDPHFSMNAKGDFKYLLFVQSPAELRTRNIFTTNNFFERA